MFPEPYPMDFVVVKIHLLCVSRVFDGYPLWTYIVRIMDKVKRTDPPAILIDDVIITSSSHQHCMTSRDRWACHYKMADDIGRVSMIQINAASTCYVQRIIGGRVATKWLTTPVGMKLRLQLELSPNIG